MEPYLNTHNVYLYFQLKSFSGLFPAVRIMWLQQLQCIIIIIIQTVELPATL